MHEVGEDVGDSIIGGTFSKLDEAEGVGDGWDMVCHFSESVFFFFCWADMAGIASMLLGLECFDISGRACLFFQRQSSLVVNMMGFLSDKDRIQWPFLVGA